MPGRVGDLAKQRQIARIGQAAGALRLSDSATARSLLDRCRPGPGEPDRRGWEWSYLDQWCRPELRTIALPTAAETQSLAVSPDGRFLVSLMQEPGLHGWRLSDGQNLRMSGYEARVRSVSWSAGGKWLATSGATQLVLWPFAAKDGPMGKTPRLLPPSKHRVEVVACHPKLDMVATAYADGVVLLVRIEDGAVILAKTPGASPVMALAWSASGDTLAFGTEDGAAGIISMP
jgi:WD40 repeat protein